MFTPFARGGQDKPAEEKPQAGSSGGEMDELKRQLEEMQKKIDRLSSKDE
jgi:polyhydroxyalkanoate synthesis regulator protein